MIEATQENFRDTQHWAFPLICQSFPYLRENILESSEANTQSKTGPEPRQYNPHACSM